MWWAMWHSQSHPRDPRRRVPLGAELSSSGSRRDTYARSAALAFVHAKLSAPPFARAGKKIMYVPYAESKHRKQGVR